MHDISNEIEYLGISDAAEYLRVSASTLRRWEKKAFLVPERTPTGIRRYTKDQLDAVLHTPVSPTPIPSTVKKELPTNTDNTPRQIEPEIVLAEDENSDNEEEVKRSDQYIIDDLKDDPESLVVIDNLISNSNKEDQYQDELDGLLSHFNVQNTNNDQTKLTEQPKVIINKVDLFTFNSSDMETNDNVDQISKNAEQKTSTVPLQTDKVIPTHSNKINPKNERSFEINPILLFVLIIVLIGIIAAIFWYFTIYQSTNTLISPISN